MCQCWHCMDIWGEFATNSLYCKVHPRIGHEGPEGKYRFSSTLFLTSALDGCGWSMPHPGCFPPEKRPGTHCTGVWVGPRAGVDRCGKSSLHQDSIPGPSSPVVSRYTDWAILAHTLYCGALKIYAFSTSSA